MKSHSALPTCLLLLWTLTVFVSCQDTAEKIPHITVSELADGIKLICPTGYVFKEFNNSNEKQLEYRDNNTDEYECTTTGQEPVSVKIYVKFRTCDNCIEIDTASVSGMVIGDVVATIVVGVGVYLIASHARTGPVTSSKKSKSSDRQHLVPESRGPTNEHYQPLRSRGVQKDVYDQIQK